MPTFFSSLSELDQRSRQLDALAVVCPHCLCSGNLIGHGRVFRKAHGGISVCVGKRIRCSARYGRNGCGRTIRLYLAHRIPSLQHGADAVQAFVLSLLAGVRVDISYQNATSALSPRNAWRWMNRLRRRLPEWRSRLMDVASVRSGPFAVLFPTLAAWLNSGSVADSQTARNMAFF